MNYCWSVKCLRNPVICVTTVTKFWAFSRDKRSVADRIVYKWTNNYRTDRRQRNRWWVTSSEQRPSISWIVVCDCQRHRWSSGSNTKTFRRFTSGIENINRYSRRRAVTEDLCWQFRWKTICVIRSKKTALVVTKILDNNWWPLIQKLQQWFYYQKSIERVSLLFQTGNSSAWTEEQSRCDRRPILLCNDIHGSHTREKESFSLTKWVFKLPIGQNMDIQSKGQRLTRVYQQ